MRPKLYSTHYFGRQATDALGFQIATLSTYAPAIGMHVQADVALPLQGTDSNLFASRADTTKRQDTARKPSGGIWYLPISIHLPTVREWRCVGASNPGCEPLPDRHYWRKVQGTTLY